MKNILLQCYFYSLFCSFLFSQNNPNVVYIISNDQAWTDYSFMSHHDIQTPHLDKLAQRKRGL